MHIFWGNIIHFKHTYLLLHKFFLHIYSVNLLKEIIKQLKYQENNLSLDSILNRLNLYCTY
jgi:hypothetical protein